MCLQLDSRRGQHPGERSLLGFENSVFVLGISFPTLSIVKSPHYLAIESGWIRRMSQNDTVAIRELPTVCQQDLIFDRAICQ